MSSGCRLALLAVALVVTARPALAQTFDVVGTRAAGMGGAFVAVADDATATYWNPAGLALGHPFSTGIDRKDTEVKEKSFDDRTSHDSGSFAGFAIPVLGFSYYRLRTTAVTPVSTIALGEATGPGLARSVRLDKLSTHQTGITLVQSLFQGVAVGTTLKVVHGDAASVIVPDGGRTQLLDRANDLPTDGTNKFDADVGVIAGGGRLKTGLTIRNLTEPSFTVTGTSSSLRLSRQARAGIAISVAEGWAVSSDFDLTKNGPVEAPVRIFAAGTEGRLVPKVYVRSGFHLNTTGDARPSFSAGGSYGIRSSVWIDGQATWGPRNADRGWGISTRVTY
jgi:hypothetical protein